MKSLDEMTITELEAFAYRQCCQRDQAVKALEVLENLIQLRRKEEHDKKQPDPAPQPPHREEAPAN